jgi:hypothetical protein
MKLQEKLEAIDVMINRSIYNQICIERELSTIQTLDAVWTNFLKKKLKFQKEVTLRLSNYKKATYFKYLKLFTETNTIN